MTKSFFKYPPPAGSKCWVTGWGKDAFLQKVKKMIKKNIL